tara:strand:- start:285 stop:527 length:243 start_codon:yes stop_codon:yes gene_type:complete
MRQAGLKPKSHSSGVYWVRANGSTKGGKGKQEESDHNEDFQFLDFDHDGKVDLWDIAGWIIVASCVVAWFVFLIYLDNLQ